MNQNKQISTEVARDILENIQGGVILCNYDLTTNNSEIIYINRGWSNITGYTMEQLNAEQRGNPQLLILAEDKVEADAQYAQQLTCGNTYELLYRIVHRSGELRWVVDKGMITPLSDGRMQNQCIVTEVTAIKLREEQMTLLAQTDQLTGLSNKATFTLLAEKALSQQEDCKHALLMLDIDKFKSINDSYGHDFGDKVLAAVAQRLKKTFQSSDLVGRVGGDEFMVLMTDVYDKEAVLRKTEELCTAVQDIHVEEQDNATITITVSVGVSFFIKNKSFADMFAEADEALYCAKGNGRNQYIFAEVSQCNQERHTDTKQ